MRPATILAALLLASSNMVHAATPGEALQQQRAKINDAVDARNRFLDRPDTFPLSDYARGV